MSERSTCAAYSFRRPVWILIPAVVVACGARSLPELTCPSDQTACAGTCVAVAEDPQNCGACGRVCPHGTVCYAGACGTSCGGGTTQCGQSCFDTNVDSHHCGGCDVACPPGEACVQGACTTTCAQGQTLCTPDAGAYCASTSSDNANCGGCGHACGASLLCADGVCADACASDQILCSGDGGSPYCASAQTDDANCGSCGVTCGPGTQCAGGKCTPTCAPGLTLCGQECVDTTSDIGHCGACYHECSGGYWPYCSDSRCIAHFDGGEDGAIVWDGISRIYWAAKDPYPGIYGVFPYVAESGGLYVASALAVDATLSSSHVFWADEDLSATITIREWDSPPYPASVSTLTMVSAEPLHMAVANGLLFWRE